MKTNLKQLSREELSLFMSQLGQKPYRTKQLLSWIYKKLALSFNEMTDLPKDLRTALESNATLSNLRLLKSHTSNDNSRKFLFELSDGESIESVLIPNKKGNNSYTLCISSQVGCAVNCKFCTTGSLGLKRNLKACEIVDQVIKVKRIISDQSIPGNFEKEGSADAGLVSNIVYMGMGEPFNNFHEVRQSLITLTELMGFSKRNITVSTAGIVPGINKLAEQGPIVNLAISINATTDSVRNRIMPINMKYPLKDLLKACSVFPLPPNRRITFEYVLLGGLNDYEEDARRLVELLAGIRSKVNLIPYNPANASDELKSPSENSLTIFQDILRKARITVITRKSMGSDIAAACGQLKAQYH